jgi:lipopolysaccharide transport system permease protein
MAHEDTLRVIEAGRAERHYWGDLWRYRELFYFLARKDILVRYKQTVIGLAWVLIKPALTLALFTLIFGKLANLPSGDVPYALLVCAGLLPWLFFASSLNDAAESLVANAPLLTKVYFPRVIVPASTMLVNLLDFLLAGLLLAGLMVAYGVYPDWRICALPALVALLLATVAGLGLWLSALSVRYRDFKYITPFAVQLSLYASPVAFSSSLVPEAWRGLFYLNPLAGIIDGFRWALLGGRVELYLPGIAWSVALAAIMLVSGVAVFRKTERNLADNL